MTKSALAIIAIISLLAPCQPGLLHAGVPLSKPATTQAAATRSAISRQAATQPVTTQPAASQPASSQPTSQPTTQPATSPTTTTQPTTQPIFSIRPASPVSIDPAAHPILPAGILVYVTSPAPATVHVDALNLIDHPADWLIEKYSWNFGDLNGPLIARSLKLSNIETGPVAGYQFSQPGTYTITLTRISKMGQTITYAARVIVPRSQRTVFYIAPDGNDINTGTDPNHPLRSAPAAISRLADHTEFRFRRGSVYTFEPEFPVKHQDILIDSYGNPALPLPVLMRTPGKSNPPLAPEDCMTFTTWPGQTADVTIQNLRINSSWMPTATVDHYAYHAPAATFGILRGSNITVANCEFENLVEGPHGDQAAAGLFLFNNRQVDPLGIPSRTLWLEGSEVVAIGNSTLNSVNESPLRAAATGVIRGLIAYNSIAQQLDPAHNRATAKAAITLRTLADVTVANNQITNAEFSFDPHSAGALDERILVINNSITNSMLDIKTNVRHAIFANNTITRDGGPCITLNPGSPDPTEWIEDLHLENNTGQGWLGNGRMMQINPYGTNQLRQFVCDPMTNRYNRIELPTSQPK